MPENYFCAEETEYLGYVLTKDGIKPQRKKIEGILALKPPTKVNRNPVKWVLSIKWRVP